MAGFFSKLFGKNQSPSETGVKAANLAVKDSPETPMQNWFDKYPHDKEQFLIREIKRSPYVNHDYDDALISHANGEIDIFSQDSNREAFTPYAFEIHTKPKDIWLSIQRNASTKFNMVNEVSKAMKLKLTEFEYGCAGDERDCDWCSENKSSKFRCDVDFIEILEKNCSCQYNRSVILPFIQW